VGIREQPADFHPRWPDPLGGAAVLAPLPRREKGDAIPFNLPYLRYVRKDERRPIFRNDVNVAIIQVTLLAAWGGRDDRPASRRTRRTMTGEKTRPGYEKFLATNRILS